LLLRTRQSRSNHHSLPLQRAILCDLEPRVIRGIQNSACRCFFCGVCCCFVLCELDSSC
jgi:hypothetical protein